MLRLIVPIATVGLLLQTAGEAWAIPIEKGTAELRPVIGATANLGTERRQESQLQLGLDWAYSLNGPLSFVLGTWVGFGDGYVGLEAHAGVKYRIVKLHPKVAPFIVGGLGFTAGLNPPVLFERDGQGNLTVPVPGSDDTLTGFGIRFGAGIDYFITPRILAGFQLVFDLGFRFSPGNGFLGSLQLVSGVSFLL